jgi:hypothetical protein
MADDFDDTFVATRRQLRGVAESLVAGPQYRESGTIRLAVRPDGFSAVALPFAVRGTELVYPSGSVTLAGRVGVVAATAGIDAGPPAGAYAITDPLPLDADLKLDAAAAQWVYRCHYAGGHALKQALPEQHPVLWPEHFDVAVTENEVNYGVSAGDDHHPRPYAYIGPWNLRTGHFWNAPFGALHELDPEHDIDALAADIVEFYERGRSELR